MFTLFLLAVVCAWYGWDLLRDKIAEKQEADRLEQRAALHRQMLAQSPDSPAAHERLGDALRAAGDLTEAIASYEKAIQLAEGTPSVGLTGSGLENKLRLTRLEMAQEQAPDQYGTTMRTRPQICRTCGALSQPQDRECSTCGTALPVDGFLDTLRSDRLRQSIVGETLQVMGMLAIVTVALLIASWMPIEIRGVIAIAALIVIPFRLLKRITQD